MNLVIIKALLLLALRDSCLGEAAYPDPALALGFVVRERCALPATAWLTPARSEALFRAARAWRLQLAKGRARLADE